MEGVAWGAAEMVMGRDMRSAGRESVRRKCMARVGWYVGGYIEYCFFQREKEGKYSNCSVDSLA